MTLSFSAINDYSKRRFQKLLKEKETIVIVAGFVDYFSDSIMVKCVKCGTPCFAAPWLKDAISSGKAVVICVCCADPQIVDGLLTMDLARIETELEKKELMRGEIKNG